MAEVQMWRSLDTGKMIESTKRPKGGTWVVMGDAYSDKKETTGKRTGRYC